MTSKRPLLKDLRYRAEAALAYAAFGVFRLLPVAWASAAGGSIARMFGPLSSAHQTAKSNLRNAFPTVEPEEISIIQAEAWDNLGRVTAEYAALSCLRAKSKNFPVDVQGADYLDALNERNTPAIIFSGHIANWEILPIIAGRFTKPPSIVYRAPNNPYVESLLQACRGASPALHIPKGQSGARGIMRALKDGGIVGMLIDQKSNTGLPIPLFGKEAMTGDAVARIAIRQQCVLVPAQVERLDGCRFRVTFEEPWRLDGLEETDTNVRQLLERMNQRLETWVKARPGQWLWMHNRWPKDPCQS